MSQQSNQIDNIKIAEYLEALLKGNLKNQQDIIQEISLAIEINSITQEAFILRGMLYELQNSFDKALTDFIKSFIIGPEKQQSIICIVNMLKKMDKIQQEQVLKSIKEQLQPSEKEAAEIIFQIGIATKQSGNLAGALSFFEEAILLNSNDPELHIYKGNVLIQMNRIQDGFVSLNRALELDPNNKYANYNRGMAYSVLNKFLEAIAEFTKTLQLDPQYLDGYKDRAFAYEELKQFDKAFEDLSIALEIDPNNCKTYYNRGNAYFEISKFIEAEADYSQALKLNPQFKQCFVRRGRVYFEENKFDQAIRDLTNALLIDSKYRSAYLARANIYQAQNKYSEAISDYNNALKIEPADFSCYNNRANVYKAQDKQIEAIKDYTEALKICQQLFQNEKHSPEISNQYRTIAQNRGDAYLKINQYLQAITDFSTALIIDSNDADLYNIRGNAYLALIKLPEAIEDYQNALKISPNHPQYLINLGSAYISCNQPEKAEIYINEAKAQLNGTDELQMMQKYGLTNKKLDLMKNQILLLNEIDTKLKDVNTNVKQLKQQNTFADEQEQQFEKTKNEISAKIVSDVNNENQQIQQLNDIVLLLQQQINFLHQQNIDLTKNVNQLKKRQEEMEKHDLFVIEQTLKQYKKQENNNKYQYYLSFCSRLQTIFEALLAINTNLIQSNTESSENTSELIIRNINSAAQIVSPFLMQVPIIGSAIQVIFELLNSEFEKSKQSRFQQKLDNIVAVLKSKAATLSEREREIQLSSFAIIETIQEEDLELVNSEYYQAIKSIQELEIQSIKNAKHPYWQLGIEHSIIVLKYIESNSQQIVSDQTQSLKDVIRCSLEQRQTLNMKKSGQENSKKKRCCQIF